MESRVKGEVITFSYLKEMYNEGKSKKNMSDKEVDLVLDYLDRKKRMVYNMPYNSRQLREARTMAREMGVR